MNFLCYFRYFRNWELWEYLYKKSGTYIAKFLTSEASLKNTHHEFEKVKFRV